MYYDYSFCDNIQAYKKELEFLNDFVTSKEIVAQNATTMPFCFPLSKTRKITALFSNLKCFYMFAAWETEKEKFLSSIDKYAPFDDNLLNFASNNTLDIDPWDQSILQYVLSYSSKGFCSFDGPFNDFDNETYRKHLVKLMKTRNKNIIAEYQQKVENKFNIYEFPNKLVKFLPNSLIITNRYLEDYDLLFEDKLKIYGV